MELWSCKTKDIQETGLLFVDSALHSLWSLPLSQWLMLIPDLLACPPADVGLFILCSPKVSFLFHLTSHPTSSFLFRFELESPDFKAKFSSECHICPRDMSDPHKGRMDWVSFVEGCFLQLKLSAASTQGAWEILWSWSTGDNRCHLLCGHWFALHFLRKGCQCARRRKSGCILL